MLILHYLFLKYEGGDCQIYPRTGKGYLKKSQSYQGIYVFIPWITNFKSITNCQKVNTTQVFTSF